MFNENFGTRREPTEPHESDGKGLDQYLQIFLDSDERINVIGDSVTIPSHVELKFTPCTFGPNTESDSLLFPFQQKTGQGTIWTSARIETTKNGYRYICSLTNPYYKNVLIKDARDANLDRIGNYMKNSHHREIRPKDEQLLDRLDEGHIIVLNTISVLCQNPKVDEQYLYAFQELRVIKKLNKGESDCLRLIVKKRNPRSGQFEDLRVFDDVPPEVLSLEQFNAIIDKSKRVMESRRRKDLGKGSSQ